MMQSQLPSRLVLSALVAAPASLMGALTVTVLLPTLQNSESKFYGSRLGYPALQRIKGDPIKVQTASVELKSVEESVAAPGESAALQAVNIRPQLSSPVEKVYVVEGQQVRRGQPLLQLQKAPFVAQVDRARNNLATAEQNLLSLQISAPERMLEREESIAAAKARLNAAGTKLSQIDALAAQELKNNVEAAQARLQTAERKLKQLEPLAEQGAISKFQLYDMQDIYATRKKELLSAQQGVINTETQRFNNRDFVITRQSDLAAAQVARGLDQTAIKQEITLARLTLQNSKIALQEAIRDLSNTVIYAGNDGLVSQVNIHAGELADMRDRDPLIKLEEGIVFKAFVDQARLNAIKMGDLATVRLVAYPGRTYKGRVIRLNRTVETQAGKPSKVSVDRQYTYSVWVAVDNLQMPSGLQGYVQFDRGKAGLFIPEKAVTHLSGGESLVMVAEAGQAVVKPVKLGRLAGNQREVLAGLLPGDEVILSPRALNPGDRLEVQPMPTKLSQDRTINN
jgi:HlyD family secretion protein